MARDGGFTLLEVTIAFLIAALALGALTRGAATGLQSTRSATHTQEAVSRARSHLATIGANLQPSEQTGDDGGGYRWRVRIQPLMTAVTPTTQSPVRTKHATLYAVSVTISWTLDGTPREVVLNTRRLAEAAPEPP